MRRRDGNVSEAATRDVHTKRTVAFQHWTKTFQFTVD
jgi:hypothetical protein